MKPRLFLVVLVLVFAAAACNLPTTTDVASGTGTPTGALDVLTLAAQTAQAGGTPQLTTTDLATPQGTLAASNTPLASATTGPTSIPPTNTVQPCDAAGFIQDVTIPDGTKVTPGQAFTKTWRLRNNGTCTWNTSYALTFASGDAMGAPAVISLPGNVPPNATVDLSVNMKAPAATGKYMGNWMLRNSTGVVFGVVGSQPIFVQIEVIPVTPTSTLIPTRTNTPTVTNTPILTPATASPPPSGLIYDFTGNMCKAEWRSQPASVLPCPGASGDANGYVLRLQNPTLETGAVENGPVLLTVPQAASSGVITGTYPGVPIQSGYHFQAIIGCLSGSAGCSIKYQVNYSLDGTKWTNLGEWPHTYSSSVQGIDIDLSPQAGKTIQIALVVLANGPTTNQQAVWVYPRIAKP